MRKEIRELEKEIKGIVGVESDIEFKPGHSDYFVLTYKYGMDDNRFRNLIKLCEKENMTFYLSTKYFSNKLTICLNEKKPIEKPNV